MNLLSEIPFHITTDSDNPNLAPIEILVDLINARTSRVQIAKEPNGKLRIFFFSSEDEDNLLHRFLSSPAVVQQIAAEGKTINWEAVREFSDIETQK